MDQPVPRVIAADVARVVERDFREADRAGVRAALAKYTESDGSAPLARVHLAILKLSEGNPEKVAEHVQNALIDYRDVLAWAEYPRYSARGGFDSDAEEERTIAEDWAEYKEWLERK